MPLAVISVATLVSFIMSFFITPLIAKFMMKIGHVGIDVHKPWKPRIPESSGLSLIISTTVGLLIMALFDLRNLLKIASLILSSSFAGAIGLLDDFRNLDAKVKTALTVLAITPIIYFGTYVPKLVLPFIGETRLTLVYLAIIPFALAVTANATNMIDVYNGSMVGSMLFAFIALLAASVIKLSNGVGDYFPIYSSAIIIASLLGYLRYNKYPAKVFNGDTGSLFVGTYFGALAILGRLEVVAVTAFMPQIMNGFGIISIIKGLRERREIHVRPVVVDDASGYISAVKNPDAPLTLAHLLTLKTPLRESEVVFGFWLLSIIAAILSLIVAYLTYS